MIYPQEAGLIYLQGTRIISLLIIITEKKNRQDYFLFNCCYNCRSDKLTQGKEKEWKELLLLESGVPVLAYRVEAFFPDGCTYFINGTLVADGKLLTVGIGIRVTARCGTGTC